MTKLLHRVINLLHERQGGAKAYRFLHKLVQLGFADSDVEGGIVFWRWDFWNSNHKRWLRELGSRNGIIFSSTVLNKEPDLYRSNR